MNNQWDWQEVRRRVKSTEETLAEGWKPTGERAKAILRQRAREIAREVKVEQTEEAMLEVVEFVLASERYGIETEYIREVHPLKELTPLPGVPPFVLGIMNLRGVILSVLDLKQFFELPSAGLTELNKVIVLHSDTMRFGILADAILGVRSITPASLQPALPTLTGIREEYLKGIGPDRTIILAAEKLLTDPRMTVHQEVEPA